MKTETKTAHDVPALNLSTSCEHQCKSTILINTSLQRGVAGIQRISTVLTVSIKPNYPSSDGEIKNQKAPKAPYFKAFQTFSKKEFTRPCLVQKAHPTKSDHIRPSPSYFLMTPNEHPVKKSEIKNPPKTPEI
jgi:hypothetical protein